MKINNLIISIIFLQAFIFGCSNKTEQSNKEQSTSVVDNAKAQPETIVTTNEDGLRTYGLIGDALFSAILDTIQVQELSESVLIQSKWDFVPFPDCISSLTFNKGGTGAEYNCEIEEEYSFTYTLSKDTLNVTEYHVPHVDNPEGKTLKSRDDKYVLNNNSLTLIGSTMYNNAGIPFEPKIEVIIQYEQKKN